MSVVVPLVDFGRAVRDFGRHRAGFPESFFNRLVHFGVGLPGQRILDMGTGTGTLARGLAMRGAQVVGIDPSDALLEEARRLSDEMGVRVNYVSGTIENSGLPDNVCEVITAGQCWHWFDRPKAVAECRRLLVPDGRLVIAHFDWLPYRDNVVEATETLIKKHNSAWAFAGGTGIYPEWLSDVGNGKFVDIETFSFAEVVLYTHEAWRGRIRASAGVGAAMSDSQVAVFDAELAEMLESDFPHEPLRIPHRVWAVVCTSP